MTMYTLPWDTEKGVMNKHPCLLGYGATLHSLPAICSPVRRVQNDISRYARDDPVCSVVALGHVAQHMGHVAQHMGHDT